MNNKIIGSNVLSCRYMLILAGLSVASFCYSVSASATATVGNPNHEKYINAEKVDSLKISLRSHGLGGEREQYGLTPAVSVIESVDKTNLTISQDLYIDFDKNSFSNLAGVTDFDSFFKYSFRPYLSLAGSNCNSFKLLDSEGNTDMLSGSNTKHIAHNHKYLLQFTCVADIHANKNYKIAFKLNSPVKTAESSRNVISWRFPGEEDNYLFAKYNIENNITKKLNEYVVWSGYTSKQVGVTSSPFLPLQGNIKYFLDSTISDVSDYYKKASEKDAVVNTLEDMKQSLNAFKYAVTFEETHDSNAADLIISQDGNVDRPLASCCSFNAKVHKFNLLKIRSNYDFLLLHGVRNAIITHELGHAFGLPHQSGDVYSIMNYENDGNFPHKLAASKVFGLHNTVFSVVDAKVLANRAAEIAAQ
ncbi:hypothetical protein [Photobacterium indicum]|uniref:hypothetical protein n=1 Tax=Photobacterium indicum TaxID=81447 RepID=UPI003D095B84